MTKINEVKGLNLFLLPALLAFVMTFMVSPELVAYADETVNNGIPTVELGDNGVTIGGSGFNSDEGSAWNQIISKYRTFIVGISGIAAITMVVIFIFNFLKLGTTAGNPPARSQAISGLIWSGLAAAGLGSVSLIVGLFYRSIQ